MAVELIMYIMLCLKPNRQIIRFSYERSFDYCPRSEQIS